MPFLGGNVATQKPIALLQLQDDANGSLTTHYVTSPSAQAWIAPEVSQANLHYTTKWLKTQAGL
jgi:hypothetical protein